MYNKLFNKDFYLLWQGQAISMLGNQVFSIATIFWIKHVTGSASLIGLIGMLSTIPAVVLAGFGGAFADRYSRRNIMIYCDLINGIAVLFLSAMLIFIPDERNILLAGFIIISILGATVNSFFQPAVSAAIPDIVPSDKITGANSIGQASLQLSTFLGQGLGGVLFRLLGAPVLILFNGLSYLFAAFCELFMKIPQSIPEKSNNWREQSLKIKHDISTGFKYVWQNRGLKNLVLLFSLINFITVPVIILLPFYVEDHLKVSIDWYGFLLAAYGVGSLIGYAFAGIIKVDGKSRSAWVLLSIIFQGVGFAVFGLINSPLIAILLGALAGMINGFIGINVVTMLQITTPSDLRGRVFGFLTSISGAMAPLGMGLAGIIFDMTGKNIPLIYVSCGTIMFLIAMATLFNKDFRTYLSYNSRIKEQGNIATEDVNIENETISK